MRPPIVILLLCALMALISCKASKPNIIFIYADDLGSGLLSVNGQKIIETPNIDKLSEQGISFKNSYGCAYCLPARASLLTGLHDSHSNGWNYVPGRIWIDYREGKYSFKQVVDSVDRSHFPIPDEAPVITPLEAFITAECDAIPDPSELEAIDNCGTVTVSVLDFGFSGGCQGDRTSVTVSSFAGLL